MYHLYIILPERVQFDKTGVASDGGSFRCFFEETNGCTFVSRTLGSQTNGIVDIKHDTLLNAKQMVELISQENIVLFAKKLLIN